MSKRKIQITFEDILKNVKKQSKLFKSLEQFTTKIYDNKKSYSRKIKHKKREE